MVFGWRYGVRWTLDDRSPVGWLSSEGDAVTLAEVAPHRRRPLASGWPGRDGLLQAVPRRARRGRRGLAVVDLVGAASVCALVLPAPLVPVCSLSWVLVLAFAGSYTPGLFPGEPPGIGVLGQVTLVLMVTVELAAQPVSPTLGEQLLLALVATLGTGLAARLLLRLRWHGQRLHGVCAVRRLVVVGSRGALARALTEIRQTSERDLEIVGTCVLGGGATFDVPTEHGYDGIVRIVTRVNADAVLVLPCQQMAPTHLRRLAWDLETTGTELLLSAGLPDVVLGRARLTTAGSLPVLHLRRAELHGVRRGIKEIWERAVALGALTLLAPVLLALIVLIRLDSPGPALFRQLRVGRDERGFTMYKLRTMTLGADRQVLELHAQNEADGSLFKIRSDPRVTRLGRFLRRYSLDELPQLWNVVRGDMALVGPRPPLPGEVAAYESDTHRRMAVKPGLTGLWQVSGRSDLPWAQSIRLDLFYVDNWSLGLDLVIVLRTFHAVVSHAGAY